MPDMRSLAERNDALPTNKPTTPSWSTTPHLQATSHATSPSNPPPSGSQTARDWTPPQRDAAKQRKPSLANQMGSAFARSARSLHSPRGQRSCSSLVGEGTKAAPPVGATAGGVAGGSACPTGAEWVGVPPTPSRNPSTATESSAVSAAAPASAPVVRRTKSRRWSDPSTSGPDIIAINKAMGLPADYSHGTSSLVTRPSPLSVGRTGSGGASSTSSEVQLQSDAPSYLMPRKLGASTHGGSALQGAFELGPDGEVPVIRVLKQGMLTKLSKGGFTANWNRRAFALIGSSLFYAKDKSALTAQPKVFAEIAMCDVRPYAEGISGHAHVFAIQLVRGGASVSGTTRSLLAEDSTHGGHEMLLLAADTPRDKYATRHLHDPPPGDERCLVSPHWASSLTIATTTFTSTSLAAALTSTFTTTLSTSAFATALATPSPLLPMWQVCVD